MTNTFLFDSSHNECVFTYAGPPQLVVAETGGAIVGFWVSRCRQLITVERQRLPSIGHRILNNRAPIVAARFKAGFWFGHADVTFLDSWSLLMVFFCVPEEASCCRFHVFSEICMCVCVHCNVVPQDIILVDPSWSLLTLVKIWWTRHRYVMLCIKLILFKSQEWLWSIISCRSALSPLSRRDLMMFSLGGVLALTSMLWMDAMRPKRLWCHGDRFCYPRWGLSHSWKTPEVSLTLCTAVCSARKEQFSQPMFACHPTFRCPRQELQTWLWPRRRQQMPMPGASDAPRWTLGFEWFPGIWLGKKSFQRPRPNCRVMRGKSNCCRRRSCRHVWVLMSKAGWTALTIILHPVSPNHNQSKSQLQYLQMSGAYCCNCLQLFGFLRNEARQAPHTAIKLL